MPLQSAHTTLTAAPKQHLEAVATCSGTLQRQSLVAPACALQSAPPSHNSTLHPAMALQQQPCKSNMAIAANPRSMGIRKNENHRTKLGDAPVQGLITGGHRFSID